MGHPAKIAIWGAGGQARVIADILDLLKYSIVGYVDDLNPERKGEIFDRAEILGGREALDALLAQGITKLMVAFGNNAKRLEVADFARAKGFQFPSIIHPSAVVARTAKLGEGVVVFPGAVIGANASVGDFAVVTTLASIDHDSTIERGVLLAPGVHLCGGVQVGARSQMGAGSVAKEKVQIGSDCTIGAGSVVLKNIPAGVTAFGSPARVREELARVPPLVANSPALSWRDLGVVSGRALFPAPVRTGTPNFPSLSTYQRRLERIYKARTLSNQGPFVQELERRIADYLKVKHCILTHNATQGLTMGAQVLDLSGEVIVPSWTFLGTAQSLSWIGITPVFADVGSDHNLSVAEVVKRITPKTTGILGVHLWGRPCDVEKLSEVARHHNLKLYFDAAHAFGVTHRGTPIGNFGSLEVFSFHATKYFNCAEGGAVTTNDDALAIRLREARAFGFDDHGKIRAPATNAKMTELQAAWGLALFEDLEMLQKRNRENYLVYKKELQGVPGIRLLSFADGERQNFQYVVIEVDGAAAGLHRDELQRILEADQVYAKSYFHPAIHRSNPTWEASAGKLPKTDQLSGQTLALPNYGMLSPGEVSTLCTIIRLAIENARPLQPLLHAKKAA